MQLNWFFYSQKILHKIVVERSTSKYKYFYLLNQNEELAVIQNNFEGFFFASCPKLDSI